MAKIVERWMLFEFAGGQFVPRSKHFKSKAEAERARQKFPERERGKIGLGVVRRQG